MSGTMKPSKAQDLVASTMASRDHVSPDQLIGVIEAAEVALNEGGIGEAGLLQRVCSQAAAGARSRRQERDVKKAARAALGAAWRPSSELVDETQSPRNGEVDPGRHKRPRYEKSKLKGKG